MSQIKKEIIIDYSSESGIYYAVNASDINNELRELNFVYYEKFKIWATSVPTYAIKASERFRVSNNAKTALEDAKRTYALSTALNAPISPPCPNGLSYLPYQIAGIYFAYRKKRVLIADEMGLGKTIQAIGLINIDKSINNILVVCPLSLRSNWLREMEKWLVRNISFQCLDDNWLNRTGVVIINYEKLEKWHDKIRMVSWDLMILDEAHYLKNPLTKRVKYIFGGDHKKSIISPINSRYLLMLTGTPIKNRPEEIWSLVKNLSKIYWPEKYSEFKSKYDSAYSGDFLSPIDDKNNSVLYELGHRLRSTVMIRRRKLDVLQDLPPKFRQIVSLEPEEHILPDLRIELDVYNNWVAAKKELKELEKFLPIRKGDHIFIEKVRLLQYKIRVFFGELSKVRKKTAILKLPYCVQHIRIALMEKEKLIIFAHHQQIIDFLHKSIANSVRFTGKSSIEERDIAVKKFMNDRSCRVFIGSIISAGAGITLTASDTLIFAELDWSPANMQQAEDRCHRIGQKKSVLIQHIVLNNSLDAHMSKILIEKQSVIDKVMGIDIN